MPSPAKTTRPGGRRQGEPVSRDAVLSAAKQQLRHRGYEKTTLRAIARDAHVDPSMVLYLFGSKEELFRESLRLILDPEVLVAALTGWRGGCRYRHQDGAHVSADLGDARHRQRACEAMLQSATSNTDANDAFRGFMQNYVLTAVSGVLGGGEQARLRAMLAASNFGGNGRTLHHSGAAVVDAVRPRQVVSTDRADGYAVPHRRRKN